jgi:hypothetical protein
MAMTDSEDFAVFSDIQFLYLCGKYAAQSKTNFVEGLNSLNDYLILLDNSRDSYSEEDF